METRARTFVMAAGADPELVKGRVRSECPGAVVQSVRPGLTENGLLVEMIAAQTFKAAATGGLLAERPEIDLLLRLARTSQIARAIEETGSKKGEPFLLVVAAPEKALRPLDRMGLGNELPRRKLNEEEVVAVEEAALLNALRA